MLSQQKGRKQQRTDRKSRAEGRGLVAFKGIILLVLLALTAYGMLNQGLYGEERWTPVAAVVLGLFIVSLFVRGYYAGLSRVAWVLVVLLGILVAVKGLSLTWSISRVETVAELVRSAMYLAAFALAVAGVSSLRQASAVVDGAVIISAAVAGYGLLQKIDPAQYTLTSLGGVRVDSTLQYPNTTAVVIAMGLVLALGRMTGVGSPWARAIYAALSVGGFAALYMTFSRGGLLSLGLGLAVMFVLSANRLQMFANALLMAAPILWLVWRIEALPGLTRQGLQMSQRLEAGAALRSDLLVAVAVAFVLALAYGALVKRYELLPDVHRTLGLASVGVVVVAAGITGYLLVGDQVRQQGLSAFTGQVENEQNLADRLTTLSVGYRQQYWTVAWEEWKQHPLTGTGAGTFMYTWLQERPVDTGVKQVHNLYLEQGTETGVVAFVAIVGFALGLAGYACYGAWRASGERRLLLCALAGALVLYLFSSIFEWHWYIPPSTLLFFMLAGAAVRLSDGDGGQNP